MQVPGERVEGAEESGHCDDRQDRAWLCGASHLEGLGHQGKWLGHAHVCSEQQKPHQDDGLMD